MNERSGASVSLWTKTAPIPLRQPLEGERVFDVCVVGGGIAGLTTAYLLQGTLRVAVLDDGPLAGGETERTTAHLTSALDDRYYSLESLHGEEGARLAAESHTAAIDRIEAIVRELGLDCGFVRLAGYLFAPPGGDLSVLDKELEAAQRAGLSRVEKVERAPIPGFDTGPSLRFPDQAQLHPLRYLAGVARAIEEKGGAVFTGTHVAGIEDGSPVKVTTSAGAVVFAHAVVVATNSPVNDLVTIHTKQAAYRTYVIGARVARGSVPQALYWDTAEDPARSDEPGSPYHYVRLADGNGLEELLIAGGGDHKVGQEHDQEERFARLESWTRERFPIGEVELRWSGSVLEPIDSLAFIGRNPGDRHVYIATGDSGNGMTHGTIAGMLLSDLILGRENSWAKLYDPSRKTLRAAPDFARENLNVVAQYTDWVTPGEVQSAADLLPGQGAVVREGATKIAAYRDEAGVLHERSAVCPHLGCVVSWNGLEKSWDCPCHGSRFSCTGTVVNGPANKDLAEVKEGVAVTPLPARA